MAAYRRKKRNSGKYSSRRSDYTRRPYLPRLGGSSGGGSYGGLRNYHRSHDFRYEREPSSKPPKAETRYEAIERPSTEVYRQPTFYRSEPDQALMEKVVAETIERYRNNFEREKEPDSQTQTRSETEPAGNFQTSVESNPLEAALIENQTENTLIELSPQAEPIVEVSQAINPSIDKGPELYQSDELPVADLELLLVELDANPLEVQPEKNIEAEGVAEQ